MIRQAFPKPPVVPAAHTQAAGIMERQGHQFYVHWYKRGWRHSARVAEIPASADALPTDAHNAWMDGYLDCAAGREEWHLALCTTHDKTC
jgi:protein-disulfide isomerase